MIPVSIELELNPVPLARPRVIRANRGDRTLAFTPPMSAQFVQDCRLLIKGQRLGSRIPLEGELAVRLHFWRHHTGNNRGDLDNLVKAVLDAGNTILWSDDAQIVELHAYIEDHGPHVRGRIRLEIGEPAI